MEYGYWGLLLASFLAASILPLSSEAVFAGLLLSGGEPIQCIVYATLGNWLGGMSTYYLGWLGRWEWITKWLRIAREKTDRWQKKVQRFGSWFALLCWVPIVGDPIALALGIARSPVVPVAVWMFIGKGLRYMVLAWALLKSV